MSSPKRKRDLPVLFWVSADEMELIQQKMAQFGTKNLSAYLVVDGVNPGLTDLFTRQARKTMQEQQKSSVLQKLKQEPPAHKPVAPKNQEPER